MNTTNVQKLRLTEMPEREEACADAFIACASFEERSRSLAAHLDPQSIKCALVVHNSSLSRFTGENVQFLRERFRDSRQAELNTEDPIETEDSLAAAIEQLAGNSRSYLVDITTFTRESLLILLNQMHRFVRPGDRVRFAYTSAREYSVGDSIDKMWLSHGVRQIRSVVGFPGQLLPSQPLHLIVLAGFENDRATRLIEQYEPPFLSLGCGLRETSISDAHYEANRCFTRKIQALYPDAHCFEFSPADPFNTQAAIQEQADKFGDTSVVIAPMNTKISTAGAALAAFRNPALQLCYAQADLYNYDNYSTPGEECRIFELPLLTDSMESFDAGQPVEDQE